jgi:hypothetical protein
LPPLGLAGGRETHTHRERLPLAPNPGL